MGRGGRRKKKSNLQLDLTNTMEKKSHFQVQMTFMKFEEATGKNMFFDIFKDYGSFCSILNLCFIIFPISFTIIFLILKL